MQIEREKFSTGLYSSLYLCLVGCDKRIASAGDSDIQFCMHLSSDREKRNFVWSRPSSSCSDVWLESLICVKSRNDETLVIEALKAPGKGGGLLLAPFHNHILDTCTVSLAHLVAMGKGNQSPFRGANGTVFFLQFRSSETASVLVEPSLASLSQTRFVLERINLMPGDKVVGAATLTVGNGVRPPLKDGFRLLYSAVASVGGGGAGLDVRNLLHLSSRQRHQHDYHPLQEFPLAFGECLLISPEEEQSLTFRTPGVHTWSFEFVLPKTTTLPSFNGVAFQVHHMLHLVGPTTCSKEVFVHEKNIPVGEPSRVGTQAHAEYRNGTIRMKCRQRYWADELRTNSQFQVVVDIDNGCRKKRVVTSVMAHLEFMSHTQAKTDIVQVSHLCLTMSPVGPLEQGTGMATLQIERPYEFPTNANMATGSLLAKDLHLYASQRWQVRFVAEINDGNKMEALVPIIVQPPDWVELPLTPTHDPECAIHLVDAKGPNVAIAAKYSTDLPDFASDSGLLTHISQDTPKPPPLEEAPSQLWTL